MTGATQTDARDGASIDSADAPVLDPSVLSDLVGDLDEYSDAFIDELLATWSTETARCLAALGAAVGAGDRAGFTWMVHTLKGGSAAVGATALAAICEDLEEQLRSGSGELGAACDRLRIAAAQARIAFTTWSAQR